MSRKWMAALCALVLTLMIPMLSLADRMYLIPDSNTRRLSESELWQWDYESLGYILNEIFARHGYVFEAGGRYDAYFSSMPWYTPNADSDNSRACYPRMNEIEWYNERLVKEVRQDMRAMGTTNRGGKSLWSNYTVGFDTLVNFSYCQLKSGQKLPVYSAPSSSSWRGANGKATMSTNGAVYAAGMEDGWLLVMYETNNGGVRVGYVDSRKIKGSVPASEFLNFDYSEAEILEGCSMTDDPAARGTTMRYLSAGERVTFLTNMFNNSSWAYIETTVDGKRARGFVPAESIYAGDGGDTVEDDDEYEVG